MAAYTAGHILCVNVFLRNRTFLETISFESKTFSFFPFIVQCVYIPAHLNVYKSKTVRFIEIATLQCARVDHRRKVGGWKQTQFCSRDLFDNKPILLQSSSTTKSIRRLTIAHLAFPSPSHTSPYLAAALLTRTQINDY